MRVLLHQLRAGRRLALRRAFEGRGHEVVVIAIDSDLTMTTADAAVLDAEEPELLSRFLGSPARSIGVILIGESGEA